MTAAGRDDTGNQAERLASQDVQLNWQDRERMGEALARAFPNEASAYFIVAALGVPPERLPAWAGNTAEMWWIAFLRLLDQSVVAQPYRRLISAALARYGANPTFTDLHHRYVVGSSAASRCHVIVRADNEQERTTAAATLTELGLRPREMWSTAHAVSYAVESDNVETVRRALGRTDMGWTLVPPGQPDYLLRELFITGPDGSRFRVTDAPAAQTIRNLVGEVVDQDEGTDIDHPRRGRGRRGSLLTLPA